MKLEGSKLYWVMTTNPGKRFIPICILIYKIKGYVFEMNMTIHNKSHITGTRVKRSDKSTRNIDFKYIKPVMVTKKT